MELVQTVTYCGLSVAHLRWLHAPHSMRKFALQETRYYAAVDQSSLSRRLARVRAANYQSEKLPIRYPQYEVTLQHPCISQNSRQHQY